MRTTSEVLDGYTMEVAPIIDIMTNLAVTAQAHSHQDNEVSKAIAGTCNEALQLLSQAVPAEAMMLLAQEAAATMSEEDFSDMVTPLVEEISDEVINGNVTPASDKETS